MHLPQTDQWNLPECVDLSLLSDEQSYELIVRVEVPSICEVASLVSGLEVHGVVGPGPAEITIRLQTGTIRAGVLIFGRVQLAGQESRGFFISGTIVAGSSGRPPGRQVVWSPPSWGPPEEESDEAQPDALHPVVDLGVDLDSHSISHAADDVGPSEPLDPILELPAPPEMEKRSGRYRLLPVVVAACALILTVLSLCFGERLIADRYALLQARTEVCDAAAKGQAAIAQELFESWVQGRHVDGYQLASALTDHAVTIADSKPSIRSGDREANLQAASRCLDLAARKGNVRAFRLRADCLANLATLATARDADNAPELWHEAAEAYTAAADALWADNQSDEAVACQTSAVTAAANAVASIRTHVPTQGDRPSRSSQ